MVPRILVVSGDDSELMAIREKLQVARGYHLLLAMRGASAISDIEKHSPDLLIGSFPLEDLNPTAFCRQLRVLSSCPMLSIYPAEDISLEIELLNAGTDACLGRPFGWQEFLAYVDRLLDAKPRHETPLHLGRVDLDPNTGQVQCGGELLHLSWRELNLLKYLILHMNEPLTREQLLEDVWHKPTGSPTRTVDQYIMKLRQVIEPEPKHPRFIVTIHGYGYKLVLDETGFLNHHL